MKLHRIEAVVVRHMYNFMRSWDRLSDAVYWPVMDLLVWGLTSVWIQNAGGPTPHLLLVMLTAIVFWQIVWRANYEISVNLLEETWSHNMANLFATPLTLGEWISGVMLLGVLKTVVAMVVGFAASWLLYSLSILELGYLLVPYLASLIAFGWTVGFFSAGLVVRFGRKVQTLAWTMGFLFAPFSAVYYPVEVLPGWAQRVAYALPTTYIFESMRAALSGGGFSGSALGKSVLLNLLYLSAGLIFFYAMFEHRRRKGLQSLD